MRALLSFEQCAPGSERGVEHSLQGWIYAAAAGDNLPGPVEVLAPALVRPISGRVCRDITDVADLVSDLDALSLRTCMGCVRYL